MPKGPHGIHRESIVDATMVTVGQPVHLDGVTQHPPGPTAKVECILNVPTMFHVILLYNALAHARFKII